MKIKRHDKPQKHDYPAAASYLSLSMDQQAAKTAAEELKNAKMTEFAAKDIFRASGLSLLEELSPLLLYRDKASGKLIIADGYHRLCAVYKYDEDAMIPCKIV
jgi:hypothetical protein